MKNQVSWRRGGVFEVARLQSLLQRALPPTNWATSKGLITVTLVMPPTNGKGMGRDLSPVQSSVLEVATKFFILFSKGTSKSIKETTRNSRIKFAYYWLANHSQQKGVFVVQLSWGTRLELVGNLLAPFVKERSVLIRFRIRKCQPMKRRIEDTNRIIITITLVHQLEIVRDEVDWNVGES